MVLSRLWYEIPNDIDFHLCSVCAHCTALMNQYLNLLKKVNFELYFLVNVTNWAKVTLFLDFANAQLIPRDLISDACSVLSAHHRLAQIHAY